MAPAGSTSRQTYVQNLLANELHHGKAKFPGNRFMFAALVEEVGELAEAIIAKDPRRVQEEAVQVAAVACRIADEGDATTYSIAGLIQLAASVGKVARALLQKKDPSPALVATVGVGYRMQQVGDETFADITEVESQA
jgi:hypothetical protein